MNNKTVWIAIAVLAAVVVGSRYYFGGASEIGESDVSLTQVSVPPLSSAEKEGEALFNANCATCHGENAAGIEGKGPPLVHVIYEPNHHGDAAFLLAARNGARAHHWRFGDMPPVDGVSESDVGQIVSYVRTLQRANGIQ